MSGEPEVIDMRCPCCDAALTITRENLRRITRAVTLRYPNNSSAALNIGMMPAGMDYTVDLTAEQVARVVREAVIADAGTVVGDHRHA